MGVVEIVNFTRHSAAALFTANGEGRPLLVPVVKATYEIAEAGGLELAKQPVPVMPGGLPWGKPGESSWKFEPECVPPKGTTDVALVGHAWTTRADRTRVIVDVRVGPLRQVARVYGERHWARRLMVTGRTKPRPFEKLPLTYENAFGGWDRRARDPLRHRADPRNPLGSGFHARGGRFVVGELLPAIEDPRRPLKGFHDRPPVAGFGFTCPHWQPRVKLAGTYDEAWQSTRMPLLPQDFDARFHQGAHPQLIAAKPLRGNEPVMVEGASARGSLRFQLPGAPAPRCRVIVRRQPDAELETRLDTIVIDTDEHRVVLVWRASHPLQDGPHDVDRLEFRTDDPLAALTEEQ